MIKAQHSSVNLKRHYDQMGIIIIHSIESTESYQISRPYSWEYLALLNHSDQLSELVMRDYL